MPVPADRGSGASWRALCWAGSPEPSRRALCRRAHLPALTCPLKCHTGRVALGTSKSRVQLFVFPARSPVFACSGWVW